MEVVNYTKITLLAHLAKSWSKRKFIAQNQKDLRRLKDLNASVTAEIEVEFSRVANLRVHNSPCDRNATEKINGD